MPANSTPSLPPLLLNEAEARRTLGGISRATLFNYRRQGLQAVRFPGRLMFEPTALMAWIAEHRVSELAGVAR
jgi:hypothetical protein